MTLASALTATSGDFRAVESQFGDNVRDTLSQLIRTAFIPSCGRKFIIADFSAIEARVLAWLAGEAWRQKVFDSNGDIYCASASKIFGVNVVKNGENGHLRAKGKVAELALGYGGSENALKAMGALENGIAENELPFIVKTWRKANQNIVKFWQDVEKNAIEAIKDHALKNVRGILFYRPNDSDYTSVALLSGRRLYYPKARLSKSISGHEEITYMSADTQATKAKECRTYGAKLVENIVQATARDLLAFSMNTLKDYGIVMHVHDEIVIEAEPEVNPSDIADKMKLTPGWAKGLKLDVECFSSDFYKKE